MNRLRQILTLVRHRGEIRHALATLASLYSGDGYFDALGGLDDGETEALVRWCREACAGEREFTVVEIGTLFGFTAAALARATPPNVKIVAVDNFCWNPFSLPSASHESFTRRVLSGPIADGRVRLFVGTSADYRRDAQTAPDLVFLDGDHRYEAALEECRWARERGVRYVCGHDWGNSRFGVERAVRETFGEPDEIVGMCWLKRQK